MNLELEQLVAEMVGRKIPADKARAAAKAHLGIVDAPPSLDTLGKDADEDAHQVEGDRIMRALGFDVVRLSQKQRSKVTEGLPDRRYYHRRRRLFVWWESKAAWGRQSPAQREYQLMCDESGDPYVLGTIDALKQWLVDNQVATFDESGLPQPIPFER